jgi:deazaflavin-dependent oxidoreductase (nitroreductase family)
MKTPDNRATAHLHPSPFAVRILKLPSALYRAGCGRLLGHRFLALTHRGRRTGRHYTTVLEVVRWRSELSEAVVVSGFGPHAQWYRNVLADGAEQVTIGRARFQPTVRVLDSEEATFVLADYERRNRLIAPVVRAVLSRLVGFRYDGSPDGRARVVAALPFVAFTPR